MEVEIVEGRGAVLVVNVGHPIVTNGILCVRGSYAALYKLLWNFLFTNGKFFTVYTVVLLRIQRMIWYILGGC